MTTVTTKDGRNIDEEVAKLQGEGSRLTHALAKAAIVPETPERASTTYYEQPILKEPVWKAYIPLYFWAGGIAGGAMALGAAAQLAGGRPLRSIVMPARTIATAGVVASAALLIADLGRPSRFINMMRVFRPTSPMNMGTWILTGAGALATASFLLPRLGRRRLANAAGLGAGVFGLGLCSYTGVLIANTAVPAWQYAAKELPPLFTTSAAATAAAALDLVPSTAPAMNALRLFGNAGKVGELICGHRYERALAKRGIARHVARPWMTASKALTASSVAASLLGFRRVSGILGLGGALALRFGIMSAGRSSSRDPRATFEPQRANGTSRASVEAAVGIV